MSTFIPSAVVTAPAQPAAPPGARGRPSGDDDARSFGAVLERSRAGTRRPQDSAEASQADATTPQKPGRGPGRKEEPGSELLTIALFTPQIQANAPAAAAAAAAGRTGAAANTAPAAALPTAVEASVAAVATGTPSAAIAGAEDAAHAQPAAADGAARDAKSPPVGAGTNAEPAAASAAPTDPLPTLPLTQAAATQASAAAPTPGSLTPALPSSGTQPLARTAAAAGSDSAPAGPSATAQAQAAPDAALAAPESIRAAASAPSFEAQQADAPSPSTPTVPTAAAPMQPALDRPQAAAPAAAPQGLAPPVGSPEWAPALGHQMLRMRAGGQQVAELSLNPAGLGPLKITLGVGDNQVQAMFVSAHESVRKAVEAALPQLRSTLAEQGISLGQTSVGADARPWAGMGGFAQQQEQQRQASSGAASAWPAAARGAEVPAATPSTRTAIPSRTSGVDTFA